MSRTAFIEEAEALVARLRSEPLPEVIALDRDHVLQALERMMQEARDGTLPPRGSRHPVLCRLAVDQWPLGHPLSAAVCNLEATYRRI